MSDPFVGEIRILPYNFNPRNWVPCDGRLLQIADNTQLFAILGTIYGGDGRVTFAVPNLEGRAPLHVGGSNSATGPGLSPRGLGQRSGSETVTLTANEIPAHSHTIRAIDALGSDISPEGRYPAADVPTTTEYTTATLDTALASNAITGGGGQAHDNMQPYLAINFCIAVTGIFPTQS